MKWAGMVNNLRSAAEEVVVREIVDREEQIRLIKKSVEKSADFLISGKHQEEFTTKQGGNCKIRMNAIAKFSRIQLGEMPLKPLKWQVLSKSYQNVLKFK